MAKEQTSMDVWIERMKALQDPNGDHETQHSEADAILCEVLNHLGVETLVAEWEKVPKWYA